MTLSDIAIRRPVLTTMFIAAFVIFGVAGYQRIGVDLYPEVEFPVVTVTTILRGASAEVIETEVTDVIEEEISTIEGVDEIRSQSFEGFSQVIVTFVLEKDIDVAAQEVREKVAVAAARLPRDIEPPIVQKLDITANPIMWIAVSGDRPYRELSYYADKVIKERLQMVRGVGSILLGGFRDREIHVWLDQDRLEAYGLSPLDVVRAIQTRHVELPAGRLENREQELTIKVMGEYTSVEDLRTLVVAYRQGAPVRLSDLGRVEDGEEDPRTIARFNGKPSIGLGVRKQSGTNTVEVADRVKAALEEIRKELPSGIEATIAFDASEFIKASMGDVQFDIFFGAMLTSLVILLFLRNLRTTLISVVAIPISLIGTFAFIAALGFTINNMTMLALSLAVGVVIDDAIVVLENIFRHMEQLRQPRLVAAREGTREIAFAVIAATFSIAAVFLPVAFMKGIIGRFFIQMGLTVVIAILISLLVSLTLTPMLCSRFMRIEQRHGPISAALERGFRAVEQAYRSALAFALRRRAVVIASALALFALSLGLSRFIGREFFTQADESRFIVRFETPLGWSVERIEAAARQAERILFSHPEVRGAFVGTGFFGSINQGVMIVILVPKSERAVSQQQLMNTLRRELSAIPDLTVAVEPLIPIGAGERGTDVQYIVEGPSLGDLAARVGQIVERLRRSPGFVDVDTDLELTKPEVKVYINREKAEDLGLDVATITQTINVIMGGVDVAKFKEGGERYDIHVRAVPSDREIPSDLERILIVSRDGRRVKLSNVIEVVESASPNVINRYNRQRAATLYANLQGKPQGEALAEVERLIAETLPNAPGYRAELGGRSREFRRSFQYLGTALALSILIIYMVLAAQFESFIHPFTIMLSLPLATVGVFGLLLVTGKTLNMFSYLGIIMLVGIVTKNAILLVDFTNQLRARGLERTAAILQAGPTRLRPILMTAITTIAGMVPVSLAFSEGGETRAPLAVSVIGGMLTSTLLTLLVIPVVYTLFDDLGQWLGRVVLRRRERIPEVATEPAPLLHQHTMGESAEGISHDPRIAWEPRAD
jgi:hydrophobic/amphiphilic exporter-1 (mainly G- bacteria), HAE1 family